MKKEKRCLYFPKRKRRPRTPSWLGRRGTGDPDSASGMSHLLQTLCCIGTIDADIANCCFSSIPQILDRIQLTKPHACCGQCIGTLKRLENFRFHWLQNELKMPCREGNQLLLNRCGGQKVPTDREDVVSLIPR